MHKAVLVYFSFAITCLLVIGVFLTATTYVQLAIAILLYPLLIFFAYKLFKGKLVLQIRSSHPVEHRETGQHPNAHAVTTHHDTKEENYVIADINRRTFLKIVGASGLSLFLLSILGRRAESILFNQRLAQTPFQSPLPTGSPSAGPSTPPSPTDGYSISEIDDGTVSFYGFLNNRGEWFIMKGDVDGGTFRYTKGSSNFPDNWNNRKSLKYDYFYKVFQ